MRTTVEINDALARRVRELMAERGTTFRALVEEGLRRVLDDHVAGSGFELHDASAGSGGLVEGVDDSRWESLSRHLYPAP